jgi:hypothetical protein
MGRKQPYQQKTSPASFERGHCTIGQLQTGAVQGTSCKLAPEVTANPPQQKTLSRWQEGFSFKSLAAEITSPLLLHQLLLVAFSKPRLRL